MANALAKVLFANSLSEGEQILKQKFGNNNVKMFDFDDEEDTSYRYFIINNENASFDASHIKTLEDIKKLSKFYMVNIINEHQAIYNILKDKDNVYSLYLDQDSIALYNSLIKEGDALLSAKYKDDIYGDLSYTIIKKGDDYFWIENGN